MSRLTTRDFEVLEQHREVQTLTHALRTAARVFEDDAKIARETATAIEGGAEIPLIASGPNGVRAMNALAEQFDRQFRESLALADRLDEAVAVVLSHDEEMEWKS